MIEEPECSNTTTTLLLSDGINSERIGQRLDLSLMSRCIKLILKYLKDGTNLCGSIPALDTSTPVK